MKLFVSLTVILLTGAFAFSAQTNEVNRLKSNLTGQMIVIP